MDHQTEPRETTAAFEEATEIAGQGHSLAGDPVNGNPRAEQKGLVQALDPCELPVIRIFQHVDGCVARLDQPNLVAQCEVDRGGAHLIGLEGIDHQTAQIQLPENCGVREDGHRTAHGTVRTMSSRSHPYFNAAGDTGGPLILGHRGAAGDAPENTLLSFELALKQRADILESDVHLTRDGVPVLCHDAELDRTTDATGPLCERTLEELAQLDAAYHYSQDGGASFPYRSQGVRIPTLAQAFAAFPEASFNLELKQGGESLVRRTMEQVAAAGRSDRTLLTAADEELMDHLKVAMDAAEPNPRSGRVRWTLRASFTPPSQEKRHRRARRPCRSHPNSSVARSSPQN